MFYDAKHRCHCQPELIYAKVQFYLRNIHFFTTSCGPQHLQQQEATIDNFDTSWEWIKLDIWHITLFTCVMSKESWLATCMQSQFFLFPTDNLFSIIVKTWFDNEYKQAIIRINEETRCHKTAAVCQLCSSLNDVTWAAWIYFFDESIMLNFFMHTFSPLYRSFKFTVKYSKLSNICL